jgi:hypothetical protein
VQRNRKRKTNGLKPRQKRILNAGRIGEGGHPLRGFLFTGLVRTCGAQRKDVEVTVRRGKPASALYSRGSSTKPSIYAGFSRFAIA